MNKRLNFNEQGAGEPLLIMHGLFGSSRNWHTLARQFAQHFRVITLDLRNHGDSFHDPDMGYDVMASDVMYVMDTLAIDRAHLLGHSMGGKVAMKLTHDFSQRVERLVVADVAPVRYSHHYNEIIDPVLALDLAVIKNRQQADEMLAHDITNQRVRMFILQNLVFEGSHARWKLNWLAIHDNMQKITGFDDITDWSVATPSLFICGELSSYVDARARALIEKHFLNVCFSSLAQAGHWLHAEQPEAFYQQVDRFLMTK